MLVPNRTFSSPAYRYGFQGQEKDDELKGGGNSLNYTFRMHDPRVGKFFAVKVKSSSLRVAFVFSIKHQNYEVLKKNPLPRESFRVVNDK